MPLNVLPAASSAVSAWPFSIDLDVGETASLKIMGRTASLRLISLSRYTEPDRFIAANTSRVIQAKALLVVEVDGHALRLWQRPYQMPVVHCGLHLAIEGVRAEPDPDGTVAELMPLPQLHKAVRLSVLDQAAPWGPPDVVFPLRGFRWGASSYQNTWGALVPYNALYYHRGEDFGAIPDQLEVLALFSGRIIRTPLAHGRATASNRLAIARPDGMVVVYGHMNYESLNPALVLGAEVAAGEWLGRTGETWNGARCQHQDPHLHIALHHADPPPVGDGQFRLAMNSLPMLVEAYFRDYPDTLLACAGGYRYGLPGDTLELDAACSLSRPGHEIVSWEWLLHDGTRQSGPSISVLYATPGLYTEELRIRSADGAEDRAYAQVRIYDPAASIGDTGFGWFYHHPIRGLVPGREILFWNRLDPRSAAPVWVDFGDGTPPRPATSEFTHAYARPGLYTARLTSRGPRDESLTVAMRVVIDPPTV